MESVEVLSYLDKHDAVLSGSHFVFTSGMHGTAYVNMRVVAHHAKWLRKVSFAMANRLRPYKPDLVLGPETLGRTLAEKTAAWLAPEGGIWCDMSKVNNQNVASFSEKLQFARLVAGKRVAVVDDLLTTGSSIHAVSDLVTETGGEVVVAGVVVRRSPDIGAEHCGAPALEVLAEVQGFSVFAPGDCLKHGPCSRQVPMQLHPGHGKDWAMQNPNYPTI